MTDVPSSEAALPTDGGNASGDAPSKQGRGGGNEGASGQLSARPRPTLKRFLMRTAMVVGLLVPISAGLATIAHQWAPLLGLIGMGPAAPSATGPSIEEGNIGTDTRSDMKTTNDCLKIDYMMPNVIPHYLLNSIGSANFPYWLKIVGENTCAENHIMTVRFEAGKNIDLKRQSWDFTIKANSAVPTEKLFSPGFDLASREVDRVIIDWSIEDSIGRKLGADTIQARIVEPFTIAWDLEKPGPRGQHVPVEEEFLLASLAAWTKRPPRVVVERGQSCRRTTDGSPTLDKEDAIRACYRAIFQSASLPIKVRNSPIKFPAGSRQKITPHFRVLERGSATSLEAALLFVSVYNAEFIHGVDPELHMLIAPLDPDDRDSEKTAYVVWHDRPGSWRAIDMRRGSVEAFDENVAQASMRVAPIMRFNSEIRAAIEGRNAKGAGYSKDRSIAVVQFKNASEEYQINGLRY